MYKYLPLQYLHDITRWHRHPEFYTKEQRTYLEAIDGEYFLYFPINYPIGFVNQNIRGCISTVLDYISDEAFCVYLLEESQIKICNSTESYLLHPGWTMEELDRIIMKIKSTTKGR